MTMVVKQGQAPLLRLVDDAAPGSSSHSARVAPSNFADAFRKHHGLVCHLLAQYGVEPAAVDDAAQEVFLVVHRRWDTYDGRAAFSKWLVGIVRRVAKDHRRARHRAWLRRSKIPAWRPDPSTPLELVEREQAARRVQSFLDALPLAQREVFVMSDVVGMRGPEIAEALGVPLNTIYSRLRLARRRFEAFAVALDDTRGGDNHGR